MFNLLNNLICVALLSTNPTTVPSNNPKELSFQASAYVTTQNKIRVAVEKTTNEPVVILLRNKFNEVLFRTTIAKSQLHYAAKIDVTDLVDGSYKLEFTSAEGSIEKNVALMTPVVEQPAPARTISMK